MALIKTLLGKTPEIEKSTWLAENAVVVGDVVIGSDCTLWYHSVIRGDVNSIKIGDAVNVQDHAMIHCTYKKFSTVIGNNVSIGHRAIVHGCEIQDNVLIGMGAILMDGVVVESNSIVAAGAVVLEGTRISSGTLWAGVPAKMRKTLDQEKISGLINTTAKNYVMYANWYR
jgi:carbonic anhydrase/acetyltransferase-like protein (isoleucine patch superfamily)